MRNTGHHRKAKTRRLQYHFIWLIILIFEFDVCSSLSSSAPNKSTINTKTRTSLLSSLPTYASRGNDARSSACYTSSLFRSEAQLLKFQKIRQYRSSISSPTALHMVLTTPESIIEQASTVTLLDDLIDESVRTSARKPIMMQFDPSSGWIWRRWKGTVFSETWTTCVYNMAYALVVYYIYSAYPSIKNYLNGFGTLWGQILSITTFTLTFFVNQSYALWRKCSELSRRLQGRLHDVGMNLATHADRKIPADPKEASTYTAASRQILELMSRYIRLFNLLTYASFTRSHRPILTPRGMRRLVERGLMTAQEREVLVDAAIPATQRHSAILMWMIRLFVEGRASGHILGDSGFEQQTMEKFHIIRAQYGAIGDELQGRMPLAYAHIVQVLVDLILWLYPIMAFSTGMSPLLVVLGTGILTISYQGLFDLAKQFLDPYDNENYGKGEDPLCVDTLIAETNAGSVRWMYGFEEMPFSSQRLNDGELYEYLLPVRGYSVEELAQMEEEKIKREKALEEERQREGERRRKEEMERIEAAAKAKEKEESEKEKLNEIESMAAANCTIVDKNFNETATVTNTTESETEVTARPESNDDSSAETRTIHKVTTLPDGRPVTFEPTENASVADVEKPAVPQAVANYLASLSRTTDGKEVNDMKTNERELVPSMVGAGSLNGAVPGGQEVSPSRPLASRQTARREIEAETITYEEYLRKLAEIEDISESEVQITVKFVNAKSGERDNGKLYILKRDKSETAYDQTRLDGISSEDINGSKKVRMDKVNGDSNPRKSKSNKINDGDNKKQKGQGKDNSQGSLYESGSGSFKDNQNGEAGSDGKTNRSRSQVSADKDEPEEKVTSEEMAPMSLEDYKKEVSKIMTQVEEEMLETEAILMSKPGYDPLGWDYDDKQLAPMTNATKIEAKVDVDVKEIHDNDDDDDDDMAGILEESSESLEVLGMDEDIYIPPETLPVFEKSPIEELSMSEKATMLDTAAQLFPIDGSGATKPVTVIIGSSNTTTTEVLSPESAGLGEKGIIEGSNKDSVLNSTQKDMIADESEVDNVDHPVIGDANKEEAKPTDRVEPIIINYETTDDEYDIVSEEGEEINGSSSNSEEIKSSEFNNKSKP